MKGSNFEVRKWLPRGKHEARISQTQANIGILKADKDADNRVPELWPKREVGDIVHKRAVLCTLRPGVWGKASVYLTFFDTPQNLLTSTFAVWTFQMEGEGPVQMGAMAAHYPYDRDRLCVFFFCFFSWTR